MRKGFVIAGLWMLGLASASAADAPRPLRIGFLADLSGPSASGNGSASTDAGRMAVEEFGGAVLGRPIEIIAGDFQGKPDIGVNIAREWFDRQDVSAVVNMNNSALAIAMQTMATARDKVLMFTAASSSDLTGKACSQVSTQWILDTYTLGHAAVAGNLTEGFKRWGFISVDYTFGQRLEADATDAIRAAGAQVVGSVRHPYGVSDFSSFILQAQAANPDVIVLANATADTSAAIKQMREFGVDLPIVPLLFLTTDIQSIGLENLKNVRFVDQFYWDTDDKTRAWSKRFFDRNKAMPSSVQADGYRSVMHYLQAVQAAGTDEAKAVVAKMKELPINDAIGSGGWIREDGRVMRDLTLYEVKSPAESKYPWDYEKPLAKISADKAYRPLDRLECPFLSKP